MTAHPIAGTGIAKATGLDDVVHEETAELLETCRRWIHRYVIVSNEQGIVLACWLLHTYAFDAAETTPYIHITAPERECGKSRLMEVLEALAASPVRSSGMTAPALIRCVDAKRPTIFLDEMDAQLGGDKEYAEAIRGILNAGFRKGGRFYKCDNKDHTLREFEAYSPKCLAGIGKLPGTIASRSITIEMRRKTTSETVEAFRIREVQAAALPIRERLEAWKEIGISGKLERIRPAALDGLSDRQNDIAEPLLCIAEISGFDWTARLSAALTALFEADASAENVSTGVTLLCDIRAIFNEQGKDSLSSGSLAENLRAMDGRPWTDWSYGKGFTKNNLANQLRKYRIHPDKNRYGEKSLRGYRRQDFEDAWSRYCPPLLSVSSGTMEHVASSLADGPCSERNRNGTELEQEQNAVPPVPACSGCAPVAKSASGPHEHRGVPVVPVEKPGDEQESLFPALDESNNPSSEGQFLDVEV
jgi:hypothetical protein